MERALPVMDHVDFDSSVDDTGDITNMTAEQYLAWVRRQAYELPDVFIAKVDSSLYAGRQTKYMPEIEEVVTCPERLLPSAEWERDVISAFSDLRALLARLSLSNASRERKLVVPQLKDEKAWYRFCLGSEYSVNGAGSSGASVRLEQRKLDLSRSLGIADEDNSDTVMSTDDCSQMLQNDSDDEDSAGNLREGSSQTSSYAAWTGAEDSLPTTSLLLQFDQVMAQRLLSYQVSWLEGRESISSARGQWLYGLLARLEKPLDRTMASLLRELYRRCSQLRASLVEDESTFDVQLASLNVLIVITGSYFGQGEEYSTLSRGYEEENNDDDDCDYGEEGDDYDDDDAEYYFEAPVDEFGEEIIEDQGSLPLGYNIGDDIWANPSAMAVEVEYVSENIGHDSSRVDNQNNLDSYLKKRTADCSAEEGEEIENSDG